MLIHQIYGIFRVLFYLFPMDFLYKSILAVILTAQFLIYIWKPFILIATIITSSIETIRFTFAYLFCISMNRKLLQSVDLHKQKLNTKEKNFENNILIYYFHIKKLG